MNIIINTSAGPEKVKQLKSHVLLYNKSEFFTLDIHSESEAIIRTNDGKIDYISSLDNESLQKLKLIK